MSSFCHVKMKPLLTFTDTEVYIYACNHNLFATAGDGD